MTGRKYQWIVTGISEDKLWQSFNQSGQPYSGSGCTKQELLIAMDGYIITDITPVSSSQKRTISGMVSGSFGSGPGRSLWGRTQSVIELTTGFSIGCV